MSRQAQSTDPPVDLLNQSFQQCRLRVPKDSALQVERFFLESGAVGSYELLFEAEGPSGLFEDNTTLVFFFEQDFPLEAFTNLALQALGLSEAKFELESIRYRDFVREYEKHFRSFEVGSAWLVSPPWDKQMSPGKTTLMLRPGLAFGTGLHPTTKMMLELLEEIPVAEKKVLDLGCGSGILSIGAALKSARSVKGVDVDSLAVESARENQKLNETIHNQSFPLEFETDGIEANSVKEFQPDLVLANIIPAVFYSNEQEMRVIFESTDSVALSGIFENQKEDFEQWLKRVTDRAFQKKEKEGWHLYFFS